MGEEVLPPPALRDLILTIRLFEASYIACVL